VIFQFDFRQFFSLCKNPFRLIMYFPKNFGVSESKQKKEEKTKEY